MLSSTRETVLMKGHHQGEHAATEDVNTIDKLVSSVSTISSNAIKPWICIQCNSKNTSKRSICHFCNSKKIDQKRIYRRKASIEPLRRVFDEHDVDEDGALSASEFQLLFENVLPHPRFEGSYIDVFNFFDVDKDDFISYTEFERMSNYDFTSMTNSLRADVEQAKQGLAHLDRGGGRLHLSDLRTIEEDREKLKKFEVLLQGNSSYIDKHGYIKLTTMIDTIALND